MHSWLLVVIVVVSVTVSCYFTAMCLISALHGEPIFRSSRPWWGRKR